MLSGSDRDAAAFLEAAGIVATHQQRAIYELVRLLKQYGLWSKMKAIYPFVGGTATTHKWNLKDPRDQDAAYRLTFSGGWTHSGTGALPNGTTGYANTYLVPSVILSLNNTHLSIYSRTNSTGNYADIGCAGDSNNNGYGYLQILSKWSDNIFYTQINDVDFNDTTVSNSLGLFIGSRTASAIANNYQNGNLVKAKTGNSTNLPIRAISLSARYLVGNIYQNYSPRELAFATIGDGLTDTEAANLYNAVQRYQQLLGRAV